MERKLVGRIRKLYLNLEGTMIANTTLEDLDGQVEELLDVYQLIFLIKQYRGDNDWVDFWQNLRYDISVTILDANELDLDELDRRVMEMMKLGGMNNERTNEQIS